MKYNKNVDRKGRRVDAKGNILNTGEFWRDSDSRYRYDYLDNKGKRKSVYCNDLDKLRKKEKQIAKDLEDNIYTADAKTTLNQAFKNLMETRGDLRDSTRANYNSLWLYNVSDTRLGKKKLCDIRKNDIIAVCSDMHKAGLKYNTIKLVHGLIMQTLENAVENDIIRRNVAKGVLKSFKTDKAEKTPLTEQELNNVIEFCKGSAVYSKHVSFIEIAVDTCCRIGELTGLRWRDINFADNTISINHQLIYKNFGNGCEFKIEVPKTAAGIRTIPMTARTKKALLEIRKEQMQTGFCKVEIDGYSDFIFTSGSNNPIAVNSVNFFLSNLEKAYNEKHLDKIPHLSAHVLRHTGCTLLASRGMEIKSLQYMMGHADVSVTMNVYNHGSYERTESEMKRLEAAGNY